MDDWDVSDEEAEVDTAPIASGIEGLQTNANAWDDEEEDDLPTEKAEALALGLEAAETTKVPKKYQSMTREELLDAIVELEKDKPKVNKKMQEKERKEKEAERMAREAEALARAAVQEKKLTKEERLAAKVAQRREREDADLNAAAASMGQEENDVSIDEMMPKTQEDFEAFKEAIVQKILKYDVSPHFTMFLEALFRDSCAKLDAETIRTITKALNILANEKGKLEKGKKKKTKKPTLGGGGQKTASAALDGFAGGATGDFDDGDDYDFM